MKNYSPEFKTPDIKIVSLEILSEILWKETNQKMTQFSVVFSRLLSSHLNSEVEIHIKNGFVTKDSETLLNRLQCEMHMLKYHDRIVQIFNPACQILIGQPVTKNVEKSISNIIPDLIYNFEKFIMYIQAYVLVYNHSLRRGQNKIQVIFSESKTRKI